MGSRRWCSRPTGSSWPSCEARIPARLSRDRTRLDAVREGPRRPRDPVPGAPDRPPGRTGSRRVAGARPPVPGSDGARRGPGRAGRAERRQRARVVRYRSATAAGSGGSIPISDGYVIKSLLDKRKSSVLPSAAPFVIKWMVAALVSFPNATRKSP